MPAPAAPQAKGTREYNHQWCSTQHSRVRVTACRHQSMLIRAMRGKNRPWLPLWAFRPQSPSCGSGQASTGCKHRGQCSGHQFCSEAFQVGAGVWKGSACCIRQLSPAKVRAVLVRKCLLKPSPPPDHRSRPPAPAPLQPTDMETLHAGTLLFTENTRMSQSHKRCSSSSCAALPRLSAQSGS